MSEVHQHPDGLVFIRTDTATYSDTLANLVLDFGQPLPALPPGADDRIYAPGVRHAIMGNGNIIAAGPMPWQLGDWLISWVPQLLAAQNARRNPPPTLQQAQTSKVSAIDGEFQKRATAPITYTVGSTSYIWDADVDAVTNIMGVVVMINSGQPVPDPRPWTPHGATAPVNVTHAQLIGLGAAIASRKDTLFATKKQKQAAVLALTTVTDVQAYDVTAGW